MLFKTLPSAIVLLALLLLPVTAVQATTQHEPVLPVSVASNFSAKQIHLGEKLFNDPRLSKNGDMPCVSCHQVAFNGAESIPASIENDQQAGHLNAPSVFNAALNFAQSWDGRNASLQQQADGSLQNPKHAAMQWADILYILSQDEEYPGLFKQAFADGIRRENVLNAIAVYEQSLITPDAPFDLWLKGKQNAISAQAKKGYQLFKQHGCIACHQGRNLGGNMFQRFGIYKREEYFANRETPINADDYGRFNVTGKEQDRYVFKVPSLRNVAVTAPYLHDGSISTLQDAVQVMMRHQLGKELSQQDINLIIEFLKTLTGNYQGKPLSQP
ncbi:MAG: c-type cytochrome [gamma proteobacterium symbiont of Bathyaustriella thionipta]|nr:c-type cytochrome [gamma proteobacterium symbiont of Bathyaustriella thionipta]